MFDNIKGVLIVISVCYLFVCLTKGFKIYQNINYGKDGTTMLDNLKALTFEEFSTLTISFLSGKGFANFANIDKGILKCDKDNEEFLVFLNNDMNFFDSSDGKIFYGYMLAHNAKGLLLFTTGKVEKDIKDFFDDLKDVTFIYYDKKELMRDYKEFILNS